MPNENSIADDPAVAKDNATSVEASAATPGSEPASPTPVDAPATEVGTAEATQTTEVNTATEAQAPGDPAPEPSETEQAETVEAESRVTEEIAEVEPLPAQAVTLERAKSVPIDEPDGSGVQIRVAHELPTARNLPRVDEQSKIIAVTAGKIDTNARLDMVASLVGRLLRHPKSKTDMFTAIGDVAIGDELERFAVEKIELIDLTYFCEWLVPRVDSLR